MVECGEDMEEIIIFRPAWKTTVFFLHPGSSWRFRKSPLAVSFTWKLDSESLGDHNIVSAWSSANSKALQWMKSLRFNILFYTVIVGNKLLLCDFQLYPCSLRVSNSHQFASCAVHPDLTIWLLYLRKFIFKPFFCLIITVGDEIFVQDEKHNCWLHSVE